MKMILAVLLVLGAFAFAVAQPVPVEVKQEEPVPVEVKQTEPMMVKHEGMTPEVAIALIAMVGTTIATLVTAIVTIVTKKDVATTKVNVGETLKETKEMHNSVNSQMDKLLKIATELAFAQGKEQAEMEAKIRARLAEAEAVLANQKSFQKGGDEVRASNVVEADKVTAHEKSMKEGAATERAEEKIRQQEQPAPPSQAKVAQDIAEIKSDIKTAAETAATVAENSTVEEDIADIKQKTDQLTFSSPKKVDSSLVKK